MEAIEAFKCRECGEIFKRERDAYECEFKHAQYAYANHLLKNGYELGHIGWCCGFHWILTSEQKAITQDNCFVFSHWQCCNKPAYKIISIEKGERLSLWGCGSWDGYYGGLVSIDKLPEPHSKEELYIDGRYGK